MSEPFGDYVRGELLEQAVNRASELEAELADLRASSVVYKVRCETCDGSGFVDYGIDADYTEYLDCPDCDNGWQLAEGVRRLSEYNNHYLFPARLIEGDA